VGGFWYNISTPRELKKATAKHGDLRSVSTGHLERADARGMVLLFCTELSTFLFVVVDKASLFFVVFCRRLCVV